MNENHLHNECAHVGLSIHAPVGAANMPDVLRELATIGEWIKNHRDEPRHSSRSVAKTDDGLATSAALKPWANSTTGIHTILIGDGADTAEQIKTLAHKGAAPDFIWGGGLRWKMYKPDAVSTK
eukprot:COSAG05_NODE_603_length_8402_cov_7.090931_2_plen_124_part_00